jgi:hypothetical protein
LLGLVNTTYSIGAIVAGWFIGGPTVSENFQKLKIVVHFTYRSLYRLITLAEDGVWQLAASLPLSPPLSKPLLHSTRLESSFSVVFLLVLAREWL